MEEKSQIFLIGNSSNKIIGKRNLNYYDAELIRKLNNKFVNQACKSNVYINSDKSKKTLIKVCDQNAIKLIKIILDELIEELVLNQNVSSEEAV